LNYVKPPEVHFSPHLRPASGLVLAAIVLLLAAGCSTYDAKPDALGTAAVDAALTAPPLESIKIAASKFAHPLLPPLIIDGREGFSPDEVALMAVLASPQLRALRDQRGVAQAQVVQAGILPNPQLGYTLDKVTGDPSLINGRSLGLSWELTSLLARHDRQAGARATAGALDLDIAWQEWQTAQGARLSAFRLLALQQRLPLVRQIESDLAETLAAIKQAVARGHLTTLDLTTATNLWITAQNSRFAAEQEDRTERSGLNLALGLPAGAELALKPAAMFPALPAGVTPATLLQGLEQRRLDLVALTLGYESNEAGLRAAVKAQFPRIGLSFGRANDTSDVRTHSYGVTVDLPLFDRNQGVIATGKATRQQLFDEYVARVAEARTQVSLIFANLAAARAQLAAAIASLPEWEQLVAAYEKALETRNTDVTAYRDARGTLAARRLEQANLQQQVLELEVALEIATGRPLLNLHPSL
jgi:outer membrane protein TolC